MRWVFVLRPSRPSRLGWRAWKRKFASVREGNNERAHERDGGRRAGAGDNGGICRRTARPSEEDRPLCRGDGAGRNPADGGGQQTRWGSHIDTGRIEPAAEDL